MVETSLVDDKFVFKISDAIGTVGAVDTTTVMVTIKNSELLSTVQVNRLVAVQSIKVGEYYIGMVSKIVRKPTDDAFGTADGDDMAFEENSMRVILVGSFRHKIGSKKNVFSRSISSVPTVNAEAYLIEGEKLSVLMDSITSSSSKPFKQLELGSYSIDNTSPARLDGDKFFQRHAAIVGSTGSGKSWLVAKIFEQVAGLDSGNAVLFDLHGEYSSLEGEDIVCLKVAGPNQSNIGNELFLPYWLLEYDEMLSMLLDRSDSNAPNQANLFSKLVLEEKKAFLKSCGHEADIPLITINSPVPYNLDNVLVGLQEKDQEMVPGANNKDKQGIYYGKLTRFIQRLSNKIDDKRLRFMFYSDADTLSYDYALNLAKRLMESENKKPGAKIIDFSEVPSDILPLATSLVARYIFTVQQWVDQEHRHPIALMCDEAHLYISAVNTDGIQESSRKSFERIAKEGRKYGVGLVVITQRPSEVDKTVLSQCNNFLSMRLTNIDDQNTVKRLLPDNLGDITSSLPVLDTGEVIAVGDACLLPSRIMVSEPIHKPLSATMNFWEIWNGNLSDSAFDAAVANMRYQCKSVD